MAAAEATASTLLTTASAPWAAFGELNTATTSSGQTT